jgi:hypothetical protein
MTITPPTITFIPATNRTATPWTGKTLSVCEPLESCSSQLSKQLLNNVPGGNRLTLLAKLVSIEAGSSITLASVDQPGGDFPCFGIGEQQQVHNHER